MNVLGFVSSNDRFRIESTTTTYEVLSLDQVEVSGSAVLKTGLLLFPPPGTCVLALTPPELLERGATVFATWEQGKPLTIRVNGPSGIVSAGQAVAWLLLVKTLTPRLARWTAETVGETEKAQKELKKMMMPPKPISVMGTQRRTN